MTDPKSEPSERAAFEAWYGFEECNHVAAWERDDAGGYKSYYLQVAWEAWQARAALTPAPAQPEPPTLDKYLPFADVPTPKPQEGTWFLCAPDGRRYFGDSPIKCVRAESKERIPPQVALGRIARSLNEPEPLPAGVEPVAWIHPFALMQLKAGHDGAVYLHVRASKEPEDVPVYSAPPTLTDAQCDAIRAEERERCAKLCEEVNADTGDCPELALYCAERIRAAAEEAR